jgi:hypothetical protein
MHALDCIVMRPDCFHPRYVERFKCSVKTLINSLNLILRRIVSGVQFVWTGSEQKEVPKHVTRNYASNLAARELLRERERLPRLIKLSGERV